MIHGHKIVLLLAALATVGCSERNPAGVIHVPVLAGCADEVLQYFKKADNGTGTLHAEYYAFDHTLVSHKDIAGYMAITSNQHEAKDMEPMFNALQMTCHPTATQTFKFDEQGIDELASSFKFHKQSGTEELYASVKAGKIFLYFDSGLNKSIAADE